VGQIVIHYSYLLPPALNSLCNGTEQGEGKRERSLEVNIQDGNFVLEIGSGHNPRLRSDVLCDKFLDDRERQGKLIIDRPLVICDGEKLPFKDKTFDYVICSHVLEHAKEPAQFISELVRVSHRGYIETPSRLSEKVFDFSYHRWIITRENDLLILQKKTSESSSLRKKLSLLAQSPELIKLNVFDLSTFLLKYEWDGNIRFKINPLPGKELDNSIEFSLTNYCLAFFALLLYYFCLTVFALYIKHKYWIKLVWAGLKRSAKPSMKL